MSHYEKSHLMASFESKLRYKVFNCFFCINKYGKTKRLKEKTKRNRKLKGCFDISTKTYQLGDYVYKSCIGNYTKDINFILESFALYSKGVMPFSGTLVDQPSKIIEIFDIIGNQQDIFQKEMIKKEENLLKRKT